MGRWRLIRLGALGLLSVAGIFGLAGCLRALLASQPPDPGLAWGPALGLGLAVLLLWMAAWTGLAAAWSLPVSQGWGAGLLGSAAWSLALAWPLALRLRLPPPHNLPERPLQILMAAALLSGLGLGLAAFLRAVHKAGGLAQLSPRAAALRLGGLAWVAYLAASLWTWRWLMTGDSPHYVLVAASLAEHGTVDLTEVYHEGAARRYYPLDRDLGQPAFVAGNGRMVSPHQPLLPLLAAPAYYVGGFAGALWTESLLGALAGGLFYLLLRRRGHGPRDALLGWAVFAFGAGWAIYSQCMMSEVLAGTLGVLWLCAWDGALPEAWVFAALALLPWVSVRMETAAAGACLAWLWRWRRSPVKALGLGFATALSVAAVAWFNRWAWGSPQLNASIPLSLGAYLIPSQALRGFFGMLLDQEWGMLPWAPVLVLGAAGLSLWWRRRDSLLLPALAWCLPYLALCACFTLWSGFQAPNRYLIAPMPVLALAAVEGLVALRSLRWPWILAAASWGLTLVLEIVPWFCYSKGQGASWPLLFLGSALRLRLTSYFPSFIINTPQSYLWALGLVLVAVRLAWHPALTRRPQR